MFVIDETRLRDAVLRGLPVLPHNGRYVAIDGINIPVHPALGIRGEAKKSRGSQHHSSVTATGVALMSSEVLVTLHMIQPRRAPGSRQGLLDVLAAGRDGGTRPQILCKGDAVVCDCGYVSADVITELTRHGIYVAFRVKTGSFYAKMATGTSVGQARSLREALPASTRVRAVEQEAHSHNSKHTS